MAQKCSITGQVDTLFIQLSPEINPETKTVYFR